MNENGCTGNKAMGSGKLSAEALEKREARARKREQKEGSSNSSSSGQGNRGHLQDKTSKDVEVEEDMWTNVYDFSSFSLKVQEEFGGEACVGGTQWPGKSLSVCGGLMCILVQTPSHLLSPSDSPMFL
jgi:hypothetical protein